MNGDIYKTSRVLYVIEETVAYLITLLITDAYLARLTLVMGFSDSLTALLSSFVNLGCVFQLFAISVFKKGRAKRKVTIFYTINQLLFVLLYVIPFIKIGTGTRTALFVIFLLGGYFIVNIASSPKTNWFMALIPDKNRGSFTAYKEAISLLCGIAFRFFMGMIIDRYEASGNTEASFVVCGVVIFVMMIIHTLSLIFSKEKEPEEIPGSSFFTSMKEILCDKNTSSIIFLGVVWTICTAFLTPFLGTYQVKELGFNMTFVAVLSTVYALVRIPASMFLGRYADKNSFAKMLRICYCLVAVSFMAIVFAMPANGHIMFLVYQVFMAAAMGGINSAEINLIFDYVTPEKRKNALSVRNTFCGILGFSSTLVATPLLNYLQRNPVNLFGTHIYAQQVLALISFGLTVFLILYVSKLSRR